MRKKNRIWLIKIISVKGNKSFTQTVLECFNEKNKTHSVLEKNPLSLQKFGIIYCGFINN